MPDRTGAASRTRSSLTASTTTSGSPSATVDRAQRVARAAPRCPTEAAASPGPGRDVLRRWTAARPGRSRCRGGERPARPAGRVRGCPPRSGSAGGRRRPGSAAPGPRRAPAWDPDARAPVGSPPSRMTPPDERAHPCRRTSSPGEVQGNGKGRHAPQSSASTVASTRTDRADSVTRPSPSTLATRPSIFGSGAVGHRPGAVEHRQRRTDDRPVVARVRGVLGGRGHQDPPVTQGDRIGDRETDPVDLAQVVAPAWVTSSRDPPADRVRRPAAGAATGRCCPSGSPAEGRPRWNHRRIDPSDAGALQVELLGRTSRAPATAAYSGARSATHDDRRRRRRA